MPSTFGTFGGSGSGGTTVVTVEVPVPGPTEYIEVEVPVTVEVPVEVPVVPPYPFVTDTVPPLVMRVGDVAPYVNLAQAVASPPGTVFTLAPGSPPLPEGWVLLPSGTLMTQSNAPVPVVRLIFRATYDGRFVDFNFITSVTGQAIISWTISLATNGVIIAQSPVSPISPVVTTSGQTVIVTG